MNSETYRKYKQRILQPFLDSLLQRMQVYNERPQNKVRDKVWDRVQLLSEKDKLVLFSVQVPEWVELFLAMCKDGGEQMHCKKFTLDSELRTSNDASRRKQKQHTEATRGGNTFKPALPGFVSQSTSKDARLLFPIADLDMNCETAAVNANRILLDMLTVVRGDPAASDAPIICLPPKFLSDLDTLHSLLCTVSLGKFFNPRSDRGSEHDRGATDASWFGGLGWFLLGEMYASAIEMNLKRYAASRQVEISSTVLSDTWNLLKFWKQQSNSDRLIGFRQLGVGSVIRESLTELKQKKETQSTKSSSITMDSLRSLAGGREDVLKELIKAAKQQGVNLEKSLEPTCKEDENVAIAIQNLKVLNSYSNNWFVKDSKGFIASMLFHNLECAELTHVSLIRSKLYEWMRETSLKMLLDTNSFIPKETLPASSNKGKRKKTKKKKKSQRVEQSQLENCNNNNQAQQSSSIATNWPETPEPSETQSVEQTGTFESSASIPVDTEHLTAIGTSASIPVDTEHLTAIETSDVAPSDKEHLTAIETSDDAPTERNIAASAAALKQQVTNDHKMEFNNDTTSTQQPVKKKRIRPKSDARKLQRWVVVLIRSVANEVVESIETKKAIRYQETLSASQRPVGVKRRYEVFDSQGLQTSMKPDWTMPSPAHQSSSNIQFSTIFGDAKSSIFVWDDEAGIVGYHSPSHNRNSSVKFGMQHVNDTYDTHVGRGEVTDQTLDTSARYSPQSQQSDLEEDDTFELNEYHFQIDESVANLLEPVVNTESQHSYVNPGPLDGVKNKWNNRPASFNTMGVDFINQDQLGDVGLGTVSHHQGYSATKVMNNSSKLKGMFNANQYLDGFYTTEQTNKFTEPSNIFPSARKPSLYDTDEFPGDSFASARTLLEHRLELLRHESVSQLLSDSRNVATQTSSVDEDSVVDTESIVEVSSHFGSIPPSAPAKVLEETDSITNNIDGEEISNVSEKYETPATITSVPKHPFVSSVSFVDDQRSGFERNKELQPPMSTRSSTIWDLSLSEGSKDRFRIMEVNPGKRRRTSISVARYGQRNNTHASSVYSEPALLVPQLRKLHAKVTMTTTSGVVNKTSNEEPTTNKDTSSTPSDNDQPASPEIVSNQVGEGNKQLETVCEQNNSSNSIRASLTTTNVVQSHHHSSSSNTTALPKSSTVLPKSSTYKTELNENIVDVSESTKPSDLKSTEPSDSVTSEPSDSKSTKPSDYNSTKPSDSKSTKPSDSNSTKPCDSKSTKPSDSKSTKPSDSKSKKPTKEAKRQTIMVKQRSASDMPNMKVNPPIQSSSSNRGSVSTYNSAPTSSSLPTNPSGLESELKNQPKSSLVQDLFPKTVESDLGSDENGSSDSEASATSAKWGSVQSMMESSRRANAFFTEDTYTTNNSSSNRNVSQQPRKLRQHRSFSLLPVASMSSTVTRKTRRRARNSKPHKVRSQSMGGNMFTNSRALHTVHGTSKQVLGKPGDGSKSEVNYRDGLFVESRDVVVVPKARMESMFKMILDLQHANELIMEELKYIRASIETSSSTQSNQGPMGTMPQTSQPVLVKAHSTESQVDPLSSNKNIAVQSSKERVTPSEHLPNRSSQRTRRALSMQDSSAPETPKSGEQLPPTPTGIVPNSMSMYYGQNHVGYFQHEHHYAAGLLSIHPWQLPQQQQQQPFHPAIHYPQFPHEWHGTEYTHVYPPLHIPPVAPPSPFYKQPVHSSTQGGIPGPHQLPRVRSFQSSFPGSEDVRSVLRPLPFPMRPPAPATNIMHGTHSVSHSVREGDRSGINDQSMDSRSESAISPKGSPRQQLTSPLPRPPLEQPSHNTMKGHSRNMSSGDVRVTQQPRWHPLVVLSREVELFSQHCLQQRSLRFKIEQQVLSELVSVVKQLWPRAAVKTYGSCVTGLTLPGGDIDVVICLPKVMKNAIADNAGVLEGRDSIRTTWQQDLAATLQQATWVEKDSVNIIPHASVPIVSLRTVGKPPHQDPILLDISFEADNHHGLDSNSVILGLQEDYPMLKSLVLVIKQFLLENGLGKGYTGGLSSYGLLLMVACFLKEEERKSISCENYGTQWLDPHHATRYGSDNTIDWNSQRDFPELSRDDLSVSRRKKSSQFINKSTTKDDIGVRPKQAYVAKGPASVGVIEESHVSGEFQQDDSYSEPGYSAGTMMIEEGDLSSAQTKANEASALPRVDEDVIEGTSPCTPLRLRSSSSGNPSSISSNKFSNDELLSGENCVKKSSQTTRAETTTRTRSRAQSLHHVSRNRSPNRIPSNVPLEHLLPETQLGCLLLGFFYTFSNLDVRQTGISVNRGFFDRENSSPGDSSISNQFDPLLVEDPLEYGNNVGKNCFRIAFIQKKFLDAYQCLYSKVNKDSSSSLATFGDHMGSPQSTPNFGSNAPSKTGVVSHRVGLLSSILKRVPGHWTDQEEGNGLTPVAVLRTRAGSSMLPGNLDTRSRMKYKPPARAKTANTFPQSSQHTKVDKGSESADEEGEGGRRRMSRLRRDQAGRRTKEMKQVAGEPGTSSSSNNSRNYRDALTAAPRTGQALLLAHMSITSKPRRSGKSDSKGPTTQQKQQPWQTNLFGIGSSSSEAFKEFPANGRSGKRPTKSMSMKSIDTSLN